MERVTATDDALTAYGADGATLEFDRVEGGGFVSREEGAHAALDATGRVTIQAGQTTYTFDSDGTLTSATDGAVADSTAPLYTWATTTTNGITYRRITTITDPVSNRSVVATWRLPGATCPTAPAGFDPNAPTGTLCQVSYWDGTSTSYFYKSAQLARIQDPGGAVQDFGYSNGRLTSIRDVLAHDAVASGVRTDDTTTLTQIAYTAARATSVTQPAATNGASRSATTITYGSGAADVTITGYPNTPGYTRRVTYDESGRLATDTDFTGATETTTWNPLVDDEVLSSVDAAGDMTTLHYVDGLLSEMFGPAPAGWFGSDRRPHPAHAADVPHDVADYGSEVDGLSALWFDNATLSGPPVNRETSAGGTWTTSPASTTPFSGRFTGTVTFPSVGTYGLELQKNGRGRLWIDGTLVVDGWSATGPVSGSFASVLAGAAHEIRVDFASAGGVPSLGLRWSPPASPVTTIPLTALEPSYEVPTSSTTNGLETTISSSEPESGLVTSVTEDPSGLALTTGFSYEPEGTGWRRQLTKTLPAGTTWSYGYYGGIETRDNPCTAAADAAVQGGMLKTRTAPAAADSTVVVDEYVYDAAGRTVASRVGTGAWSCYDYDTSGRLLEVRVPAFGSAPSRTVTYDGAVGGGAGPNNGDPLVSSVTDPAGTIETTVDLLGRTVNTTDVWGTETILTYDSVGRAASSTISAGGSEWVTTPSYDSRSRLAGVSLDADPIASLAYDNEDRVSGIEFPDAPGAAGNGTSATGITYDDLGRQVTLTWKDASGAPITSDALTYNVSGKVLDQIIDGHDAHSSGPNFSYDSIGRLTSAHVALRNPATGAPTGTRNLSYEFAASGGCGASAAAGKNTNRTGVRVDGALVASPCYDMADRLTSTTQAGYTGSVTYDSHGNVTLMGGTTRRYDGADRAYEATSGTVTVTYVRDALDRVIERQVGGMVDARYAYGADGSQVAVLDVGLGLAGRTISLPGGVSYSDDGAAGSQQWAYPNLQGHIVALADAAGTKVGVNSTYDPDGNALSGEDLPNPSSTGWGWFGQFQKNADREAGLVATIDMGVRSYDPALGRFLERDPIDGGSANAYEYSAGDPVSNSDLGGATVWFGPNQFGCGGDFIEGDYVHPRRSENYKKIGVKFKLHCEDNPGTIALSIQYQIERTRRYGPVLYHEYKAYGSPFRRTSGANAINQTSAGVSCESGRKKYRAWIFMEVLAVDRRYSAKSIYTGGKWITRLSSGACQKS